MITAIDRDGSALLDGEWQIAFDEANVGKRKQWQSLTEPPAEARPITVPSCWEEIEPALQQLELLLILCLAYGLMHIQGGEHSQLGCI